MPSLLQRGASVLKAKQESCASETLCVTRGDDLVAEGWLASPGRSPTELVDETGATIVSTQFDWLGDPSGWGVNGEQTEPQRGDVVWWDRGEYVLVFEVLPADGENVWVPAGPFGDRIRVHTKLIERRSK